MSGGSPLQQIIPKDPEVGRNRHRRARSSRKRFSPNLDILIAYQQVGLKEASYHDLQNRHE
jgi:hypothetical protein